MIVVAVVAVAVDVVVSVVTVVAAVADAVVDVAVLVVTVAVVVVAVVVSTSPAVLDDLDQNDSSRTYGALKHISLKHDELIIIGVNSHKRVHPSLEEEDSSCCVCSNWFHESVFIVVLEYGRPPSTVMKIPSWLGLP